MVIDATDNKLTPTLLYLKNGTNMHKKRILVHDVSMKRIESNGNTNRQNIKSATHKLK